MYKTNNKKVQNKSKKIWLGILIFSLMLFAVLGVLISAMHLTYLGFGEIYLHENVVNMQVGETVKFSEVCPEFAEFEKKEKPSDYFYRNQSVTKWSNGKELGNDGMFVDEEGFLHAAKSGLYEFTMEFSAGEYEGLINCKERKTKEFVIYAAVCDATYEDYIPLKNANSFYSVKRDEKYDGKYIIANDMTLNNNTFESFLEDFEGIVVNPEGYTITLTGNSVENFTTARFCGILDGVKINYENYSVERGSFYLFTPDNLGYIRNCEVSGEVDVNINIETGKFLDFSYAGETILMDSKGIGCWQGNKIDLQINTCDSVRIGSQALGYYNGQISADNGKLLRVYLDNQIRTQINYPKELGLPFGRNLNINNLNTYENFYDEFSKGGNQIYSSGGALVDYNEKVRVILRTNVYGKDVLMDYGEFPKGGVADFGIQMAYLFRNVTEKFQPDDDVKIGVDYCELDGNKTDLRSTSIVKDGDVYADVRLKETLYRIAYVSDGSGEMEAYISSVLPSEKEIELPTQYQGEKIAGFTKTAFDLLEYPDGYCLVIPEKIVIPKELKAETGETVFSAESKRGLARVKEVAVEKQNPSILKVENDICSADGKRLILHLGGADETSYTLRGSVNHIDDYAFLPDNKISVLRFENLRTMSRYALSGCKNIRELYFGKDFTEGNISLAEIIAQSGSEDIQNVAIDEGNLNYAVIRKMVIRKWQGINELIYYPNGLTGELKVADGVEIVREGAFYGCKISKLILPDSIRIFYDSAVSHCFELKEIVFGASEELKIFAWSTSPYHRNCDFSGLESITFAEGIGELSIEAVFPSDLGGKLSEIYIPASLTTIGRLCIDCEKYEVAPENPYFYAEDGVVYRKNVEGWASALIAYPVRKQGDGFICPDGIEKIDEYAFANNLYLKEAVFPDGVSEVRTDAFASCRSLEKVSLGSGLRSIGYGAFFRCEKLSSVTFGGGDEEGIMLGTEAFYGCLTLTEIDSERFSNIGVRAFSNSGILRFTVSDKVEYIVESFLYSALEELRFAPSENFENRVVIGDRCFYQTALKKVDFGNRVQAIFSYAFANCADLEEVDLSGVASIGENSFSGAEKLKKVSGDLAEEIPSGAFNECSALEEVYFPKVSKIQSFAFSGCYGMKTFVTAPLTEVGAHAFSNCKKLERVDFADSGEVTIGNYAFFRCEALKEIAIAADSVSVLGYAFNECVGLEKATIKASETGFISIDAYAFYGCGGLEIAEFDGGCVKILSNAFSDCNKLSKISVSAQSGEIYANAFSDEEEDESGANTLEIYLNASVEFAWIGQLPENAVLYVPKALKEALKPYWLGDADSLREYVFD